MFFPVTNLLEWPLYMFPDFTHTHKNKHNKKQSSHLSHFILPVADINHFNVCFLDVTYSSIIFENNFIIHPKRIL